MRQGNILTVTLNPCLDRSITVKKLMHGHTNRILSERTDVGGKGINVSRLLQNAGVPTHALAVTAGNAGKQISDALDTLHIPHTCFHAPGETRTNIKVLDAETDSMTEFNAPGIPSADAVHQLTRTLAEMLPEASALVLSGSVPPDMNTDIYRDLTQMANAANVPVILDASGAYLEEGIAASPFAIKPNREEFEGLVGKKRLSVQDLSESMRTVQRLGIAFVTVSLGEEGALFLCADHLLRTHPLPVSAICPAAAGDAMVAMLCYAMTNSLPLEETARLMTAAGSLTAALPGTEMADFTQILRFSAQVQTEQISPN